jgi:ribosomal protein S18 acetylase RimI-like enzyme
MNYTVNKLSELNNRQIDQATAILVEGLFDIFSIISKDKNILRELFKDSFDYDMNYAYLHNGEVVGFLGLGNSSKRAAGNMKQETFEKLFGKRKSKMMYKGVSSGFCPLKVKSEKEVEIEFLAIAPQIRGKGVGTHLIHYVCNNFDYETCVLSVFSKNLNAVRLYERLGFKQVKVKIEWVNWLRGIGKTIIMRLHIKEMQKRP